MLTFIMELVIVFYKNGAGHPKVDFVERVLKGSTYKDQEIRILSSVHCFFIYLHAVLIWNLIIN